MLKSRIICVCAAALLAVSGAAFADDEVVLSAHPAKLPTEAEAAKAKADAAAKAENAAKPDTKAQLFNQLADTAPVTRNTSVPDSYVAPVGYESNGRTIHGSASVSVGTGGYRSASVSALIPVGENGTLGIAYSQTDFGKNGYIAGFDDYDGYGYGGNVYGYGTRSGYGRLMRGGTSKSLAVSLDMSDGNAKESKACAPGFRDGDRYIEPAWVTRMNGGRTCQADKLTGDQN